MMKSAYFKVVYIKSLLIPILGFIFILCLVLYSESSVIAASRGINLWLNVVFPSLFPFFVGADLLSRSGIIKALGLLFEPIMRPLFNVPGCGSFAFIMGVTSGYPVGAKLTTNMREEKIISKVEAERLLTFTNNSGPLFIVGAVAVGMYKQHNLGLFLLLCHVLSCITVGILFRFYGRNIENDRLKHSKMKTKSFKSELLRLKSDIDFGSMFGLAIKDSMMTILVIGGFIIFFSVFISLLLELGVIDTLSRYSALILTPVGVSPDILPAIFSGFFEITTGTNMASRAVDANFIQKLTATSAIIGWAGFSVHFQVMSIVNKANISIKPYLLGKFAQGLIAAFYTYIALKFLNLNIINDAPTFIPLEEPGRMVFDINPEAIIKYPLASLIFLAICILAVFLPCRKKQIVRRH